MIHSDSADLSFETPRVKARLLREDDLDLYVALYTDPEVMRYIGPVMGREEATAQFRKAIALNEEKGGRVRYWIGCFIEVSRITPVGILSAVWSEPHLRSVEVGIMLSGRMRRRGHGKALLSALIQYLFADVARGVDEVQARHLARNDAARGLFTSLGFSDSANGDLAVHVRVLAPDQWRQNVAMPQYAPTPF